MFTHIQINMLREPIHSFIPEEEEEEEGEGLAGVECLTASLYRVPTTANHTFAS
jgi:hypothetical protein